MALAISLDIETMSTNKDAVVLTIGATTVSLDGSTEKTFDVALDAQEQIDSGRHVSMDTVFWWMQKSKAARDAAFSRFKIPPEAALLALRSWLEEQGLGIPIFTSGPSFDAAILESLGEPYNISPWDFRQSRDVRTIRDGLHGNEAFEAEYLDAKAGMVAHNALEDAILQAVAVRHWLRAIA